MEVKDAYTFLRERGFTVASPKWDGGYFQRLEFSAKTIVDVGVASFGTKPLYDGFPGAKFVLVEPLPEVTEEKIRGLFPNLDFDYFHCAAGANEGVALFTERTDKDWFSGFHARSDDGSEGNTIEVPVKRLDDILARYSTPFGLKIDVEGFEIAVLEGAEGIMADVEFAIVECALSKTFNRTERFSDLVELMRRYGFELYDILNIVGKPPPDLDFVFIQKDNARFDLSSYSLRVRST